MESNREVSSGSDVVSQAASPQAVQNTVQNEERVFKQSELNRIVGKAKNEAVEDFKRLQSEQPNYASQKYGESSNNVQHSSNNQANVNDDYIRKIASESFSQFRDNLAQEHKNRSDEEAVKNIADKFKSIVGRAREKYSDFDQIAGNIKFGNFANTVQLVTGYVDNPEDVLYHLSNNRTGLAQIENLANLSDSDAVYEIKKISKSLKDNELASKVKIPREPLSQMSPSNTGTGDGSPMTVSDFRKMFKV